MENDFFIIDVLDPPPGWKDADVNVHRHSVTEDQVGPESLTLLRRALMLWRLQGCPGNEPFITIRRASSSHITGT